MEILHETPKDEKETLRLIQLAFYNVYMPGCEEHLLLKDLRLAKEYLPSLSFVAKDQGTIVGAIYASEAKITKGNQVIKVLTFGPLGVLPAYQKKGVGKALVHYFLKEAKKTNYPAIVITGVPTYYPRFGFLSCYEINIHAYDGVQFPALMGYELQKGFFDGTPMTFEEAPVFSKVRTQKEIDEFDKEFPPLPKEVRPTQWKHIK